VPSRFNQMAEALAKVRLSAKDVSEASPRLVEDIVATGSDVSVREVCSAVGDSQQTEPNNVRRLPLVSEGTERQVNGVIIGACSSDTKWTDLGSAVRMNLCPTFWDEELARLRVEVLKRTFIRDGFNRILTLGKRVARVWGVGGHSKFGVCKIYIEERPLQIAWIPHPKKLTEYVEQLEATSYIEWVCGERKKL
jgi:hypothetical protein